MKILYLADINSPIAQNWIRYFVQQHDEIEIISGHRPLAPIFPNAEIHHVPLLAGYFYKYSTTQMSLARTQGKPTGKTRTLVSNNLRSLNRQLGLQAKWQSYIGPLDVLRNRARIQSIADTFKPDLIHGLRIPTEGYAAAQIKNAPIILSLWGNDLTFYAKQSLLARRFTRGALQRAHGLHADCHRDLKLAGEYGFDTSRPMLVIPTAGGIQTRVIAPTLLESWRQQLAIPADAPIVINPRGTRSYVCIQEFFEAIPIVLRAIPDTVFVCPSSRAHPLVTRLVEKLGIQNAVRLLPVVSQDDLAALFQLAEVMVSPTVHDGIPNTLLEAMANGAFPVTSDLESIREWIVPNQNGLLFDPTNTNAIANAILAGLNNHALRENARVLNQERVRAFADYDKCMGRAREFYLRVIAEARVV